MLLQQLSRTGISSHDLNHYEKDCSMWSMQEALKMYFKLVDI